MFSKLGRRKGGKDKFSSSEPANLIYLPFDNNGKAEVHLNLSRPGGGHRDYPPPPPKTNHVNGSSARRDFNRSHGDFNSHHAPRSPPPPPKIEPCIRPNKKYGEVCDESRANEIADKITNLVERHSSRRGEAHHHNMNRRLGDDHNMMDTSKLHENCDKMSSSTEFQDQEDEIATEASSASTSKGEESSPSVREVDDKETDELKVKSIADGIKKLILMKQVQDHLTPGEIKNIHRSSPLESVQSPQTSKQSHGMMYPRHGFVDDTTDNVEPTKTPRSPNVVKSPSIWQEVKDSTQIQEEMHPVSLDDAAIATKNIIESNPYLRQAEGEGKIGRTVYVPKPVVEGSEDLNEGLAKLGGSTPTAEQSVVSDITMAKLGQLGETIYVPKPVERSGGLEGLDKLGGKEDPTPIADQSVVSDITMMEQLFNSMDKSREGRPKPPPPPRRFNNQNPPPPPPPRRRQNRRGSSTSGSGTHHSNNSRTSPTFASPPVPKRMIHVDNNTPPVSARSIKSGASPTCLSESCPNVSVAQDHSGVTRVWAQRLPPPPLATERESQTEKKEKNGFRRRSSPFSTSCPNNIADCSEGSEGKEEEKKEEALTGKATLPPPPPRSQAREINENSHKKPLDRQRNKSSLFSRSCPDNIADCTEEEEEHHGALGPLSPNPMQSPILDEGSDVTPRTIEPQEQYQSYPPPSSSPSPGARMCPVSPPSQRLAFNKPTPHGHHSRRHSSDWVTQDEAVARKRVEQAGGNMHMRRRSNLEGKNKFDAYLEEHAEDKKPFQTTINPGPGRKHNNPTLIPDSPKKDFTFNEHGCCRAHPSEVIAKRRPFGRGWDVKRGGCVLCKLDQEEKSRGSANTFSERKVGVPSNNTRRHSSGDQPPCSARRSSQNSSCNQKDQTRHPLSPSVVKQPQRHSSDSFASHATRRNSSDEQHTKKSRPPKNIKRSQARSKSREKRSKSKTRARRSENHFGEKGFSHLEVGNNERTKETHQASASANVESAKSQGSAASENKTVSDMPYTTPWGMVGFYSGEVTNGKPHGHGSIVFKDGGNYSGKWEHGKSGWFIETCLPVLASNKNLTKQENDPDTQAVTRDDGLVVKPIGQGLILSTDGVNTVLLSSDGSAYTVPMSGGGVQDEAATRRPLKSKF